MQGTGESRIFGDQVRTEIASHNAVCAPSRPGIQSRPGQAECERKMGNYPGKVEDRNFYFFEREEGGS
jgi:hypothetical protein